MVNRPPTLKRIAELAGVSLGAVSSVLNQYGSNNIRVSPQTRRRILQAAQQLNYRRNLSAARLAGGRTHMLGLLVDDLNNALNMPVADGIERQANRRGYHCFVACTHYEESRKVNYIDNLLGHGAEGLFAAADWTQGTLEPIRDLIKDAPVPLVLGDFNWQRQDSSLVCGNHYMGGRLLARHLLEVGHRRMAYLIPEWLMPFYSFRERIRGVRDTLEASATGATLQMLPTPFAGPAQYAEAVIELMQGINPPTAVLAANDGYSVELMIGLYERGVRVPEDIAVTGYDDAVAPVLQSMIHGPSTPPWSLPMTTIRQPHAEIGRQAADLLIDMIEAKDVNRVETCLIDVELVERESSNLPQRQAAARS